MAGSSKDPNTMRREYDFRGGVRGKYAGRRRTRGRSLVVTLDARLSAEFADAAAVLATLRRVVAGRRRRAR